MKFWLCASLVVVALAALAAPQKPKSGKSANELTLAGLRPGRDTIGAARDKFGKKIPVTETIADRNVEWHDFCGGQSLKVEADKSGVIQTMDLHAITPVRRCSPEALDASKQAGLWKTGRGLRLGDNLEKLQSESPR